MSPSAGSHHAKAHGRIVHATLKARAALAGKPLTDDLLAEIRRFAAHPTPEELATRLLQREAVKLRWSVRSPPSSRFHR